MIEGIELLFRFNHAGAMALKDGSTVNYGVIIADKEKGTLTYFSGLGLREMWKPNMTESEKIEASRLLKLYDNGKGIDQLKATGHIKEIPFSEIERILF